MRRRIEERGERCGGEGEKVIIIESQGGDLESEGREVRIVTVNGSRGRGMGRGKCR